MDSIKDKLGIEPTYHKDGDYYTPSKAAIALAAPSKTNYTKVDFPNKYTGGKCKILVPCVEDHYMTCTNGKQFQSGDHPVEMFVTLLHLSNAGFDFDYATPTGKPVAFEDWALPKDDVAVMAFRDSQAPKWQNPLKLSDVAASLNDDSPYLSVYFAGGQEVIEVLPESTDVKKILQWFIAKDKYIIAICHGPSALLALNIDEDVANFPFKGYEIEAFPKIGDKMAPSVGYMPGDMPYYFQDRLKDLGVDIKTIMPTGHARKDRKLITGDGPFGANKLGILAAETLLDSLQNNK